MKKVQPKRQTKFLIWDDVCCKISTFKVPEADLPWGAEPKHIINAADLLYSSDIEMEPGSNRKYRVLPLGTHCMSASFGRWQKYLVVWHQADSTLARKDLKNLIENEYEDE